jgi:hypothetical protein
MAGVVTEVATERWKTWQVSFTGTMEEWLEHMGLVQPDHVVGE